MAAVVYFFIVVPYTKAKERYFPSAEPGTPGGRRAAPGDPRPARRPAGPRRRASDRAQLAAVVRRHLLPSHVSARRLAPLGAARRRARRWWSPAARRRRPRRAAAGAASRSRLARRPGSSARLTTHRPALASACCAGLVARRRASDGLLGRARRTATARRARRRVDARTACPGRLPALMHVGASSRLLSGWSLRDFAQTWSASRLLQASRLGSLGAVMIGTVMNWMLSGRCP